MKPFRLAQKTSDDLTSAATAEPRRRKVIRGLGTIAYCLTEVAYPQAKMTATTAKNPIHPIRLGLSPTIL